MIFDQRFLRYFMAKEKTVKFVCDQCKDQHHGECANGPHGEGTWCDCLHREKGKDDTRSN